MRYASAPRNKEKRIPRRARSSSAASMCRPRVLPGPASHALPCVPVAPSAPQIDDIKMSKSPQKNNSSWNIGDNVKLYNLFKIRKADPKENKKKYIDPIREKHFPNIPYRNFRTNYLKKTAQWEVDQEKQGANRPRK